MLHRRVRALETQARPASPAMLDLDDLSADDRQFIAAIDVRCDFSTGKPDYSRLSVPELRRLHDISERHAKSAP